MIKLTAMLWAAYAHAMFGMGMQHNHVPMPLVIEEAGHGYSYDIISSSMHVPVNWKPTCEDQKIVVYYMEQHFNAYRNGNQKLKEHALNELADTWVCIE